VGTSQSYAPPTGHLWNPAKRGVTNLINENASSESIGKALRKHVEAVRSNKGTYNSKNQKIVSSAGRAINFINDVQTMGLDAALEGHGLSNLIGKGFDEVFVGLLDYFVEDNSSIDGTIARDSMAELMSEMMSIDEFEEEINEMDMNNFIKDYIVKYVQKDFMVHYAEKILAACDNINKTISIQNKVKDFIKTVISQNYSPVEISKIDWKGQEGNQIINQIHKDTIDIFLMWGDSLG